MRIGSFAAVALAGLAFSGIARADVYISDTLTGIVTAFENEDFQGLFGPAGANLTNSAVSITFSYDFTSLATAALGVDGSSYQVGTNPNGTPFEEYSDVTNDGAVSESVTINNTTVSVKNTSSSGLVNPPTSQGTVLNDGAWIYPATLATGAESDYGGISTEFFGADSLPLGNLGNQAAVDAFLASPAYSNFFQGTGVLYASLGSGEQDELTFDYSLASSGATAAPEPNSWFLLVLGLSGIAAAKFRRRANRS